MPDTALPLIFRHISCRPRGINFEPSWQLLLLRISEEIPIQTSVAEEPEYPVIQWWGEMPSWHLMEHHAAPAVQTWCPTPYLVGRMQFREG